MVGTPAWRKLKMQKFDYIPINWLRKKLTDLQFDQVLSEAQMKAIFNIISNYEEEKTEPIRSRYDRARHEYKGDRCWHCKWLNGEKSVVGIECTNPGKNWKYRTSKYKAPSAYACKKHFERKENADI